MSLSLDNNLAATGVAGIFRDTTARPARPQEPAVNSELPEGRGIRRSEKALDALEQNRTRKNAMSAGVQASQKTALYQDIANQQQRSELQSMLGIDLYA
ncbi:hypothetical protein [Alkalimonas sp.]|uniref:hypothetical protein n=1 Tax=Alkalimonas sp. TaxID=1872453 RepID=UPI00263AD9D4|nr:hypothetical protein [Alkalimonas sp.]MCC5827720.1 hypothetical protein [Alkalimonas sp.]